MENKNWPRLALQIALALGAIYLIWGSTYLAIRFAIGTIPPFLMAGSRNLAAGLIMYAWARYRGAPSPSRGHWVGAGIVGALLLLGGNGTLVWAQQRVPSGVAALLIATVPFWIVLLDWLWQKGKRPGSRVVGGLSLGFAGIILLLGQGKLTGPGHIDTLGAAAVLFAALSWAVGSLYSRRAKLPDSPFLITGMQMLSGGVLTLLAGFANGEAARLEWGAISLLSFSSWAYLVIFGSMVGFTCYIWLLRVAPAERVATYAYVNPVVAVFLGWAFAGESLTPQTILASGVIITAVVLITTRRRPAPVKVQEEVKPPLMAAEPEKCL